MKLNRKYIRMLVIVTASVLGASILLFLIDRPASTRQTRPMHDNIHGQQALLQVGPTYITHTNLTTYKNNLTRSSLPLPDDSTLLKEMATKELMLQMADEQGVAATLEDGIQKAKQLRKTLETQPQQVKEQHLEILMEMGISEDQYWEEYAPAEYRDMLSLERLMDKLTADLKTSEPNVITSVKQLKQELLETALEERSIIVFDPDIQLR